MSELRRTIRSLEDFVRFIEAECEGEDIIFRGQSQPWTPSPKIAREDLAFKGPRDAVERQMFEQLKREARPFMDVPLDDWELLAVAQHHGMPTRLLDWTKNPLAALWFAAREVAQEGRNGIVWVWWFDAGRCCDTSKFKSPFDCKETFIYRPSHVHRRLSAQFGWFTVHPLVDGKYVPIGTMRPGERHLRLEIPPETFPDIRKHLDRCGVNSSTMFPGIEGLCGHIQWLHSFLRDEIPSPK